MQTRSKNRKQEIVEVVAELLQTHGFECFSYRDLSDRLGITKASIHHHFPKKEDLGVALCEWIQRWHERSFAKINAMPDSAWIKLRRYLSNSLDFARGENKICPLSSLQGDIASLPISMHEALRKLDEHELSFIAALLQDGRDSGELNFPGDVYNQAVLFVLACKGALQYSRVHGPGLFEDTMAQFELLLKA
ncbi:MAG: TetR/AcrR family transcriptional regulator [Spongiibacteraceae bacterium]|nr:TetR/AcrR family transcriptional regulator [Spongiibacteraceae bacterium]